MGRVRRGEEEEQVISTVFDTLTDSLTVRRSGIAAHTATPAPHDQGFIIGRCRDGRTVGATLLSASEIRPSNWIAHPDREALPDDIMSAIDLWMLARSEARALAAEARATKAEGEIAKWQHTAAAISMCADGTSEDQTHERLPTLVAERIDKAERERDTAREERDRAREALRGLLPFALDDALTLNEEAEAWEAARRCLGEVDHA